MNVLRNQWSVSGQTVAAMQLSGSEWGPNGGTAGTICNRWCNVWVSWAGIHTNREHFEH